MTIRWLTAVLFLVSCSVNVAHESDDRSSPESSRAEPRTTMADGLQPAEAAAHMTVPPGFHVQLAAGEPMVHQPIAFTFDDRGRLWLAEAYTYPNRANNGEGKDKIVILEDTDLDGDFDTRKVFIEGLNLVSGLELGFGGIYVGAAPYLLFIPDADGDDKPDAPAVDRQPPDVQFPADVPAGATVLLDGFGWQDTHETLNSFIWGPDGWLYGCHGVFTYSTVGKPGTPADERTGLNAGVWRYHPQRHEFEVFAHGTSNPWGVDFNEKGDAFITACVIPHLWYMIPGGRYHRQGSQHFNQYTYDDIKTIADHAHYTGNIRDHAWWGHEPEINASVDEAGGGHAHCGAMIYLGDNWPEEYRGKLYFNNIHGNRVNCDILEPEGSGYVGRHGNDFLKANDRWFRGINLKYAPDGSVYLIDWYDRNACHRKNPEIWDRSNGRIYRIVYGDRKPERVNLGAMSRAELVKLQLHDNEWFVRMSRRLLQERGLDEEALRVFEKEEGFHAYRQVAHAVVGPAPGKERILLRCMWLVHACQESLKKLGRWNDIEEGIAASNWGTTEDGYCWLIRFAADDNSFEAKTQDWLISITKRVDEPDLVFHFAGVRLATASALQRVPLDQRWEIAESLLTHAEDAADHNLPLMYWYAIEPLVPADPARAMELAQKSRIPLVTRYIIRRASASDDTIGSVVSLLENVQQPDMQQLVMKEMLASFEGRVDIPMPPTWMTAYSKLANSDQQGIRDKADQLAIIFGDQQVYPRMRHLLSDPNSEIERRRQALDVLVRGRDRESSAVLLSDPVLGNSQLQGPAVRALSSIGGDAVPAVLLNRYAAFPDTVQSDVIGTLVSRPAWTAALLNAIGDGKVPDSDLHAYHVRQILSFNNKSLNQLLRKYWGDIRETSADVQQQMADWKKTLSPDFLKDANTGNGRRIFSKTCQNCHRLFGEGGDVGPDITGSNRANLDYILENMVAPSAVVGRSYQMTNLALNSGQVVNGILKKETDSALTIQTINDTVVVAKSDIEDRSLSDTSMMPERQLDSLSKEEVRDLVAYLASPAQVMMSGPPIPVNESGQVPGAIEAESLTE